MELFSQITDDPLEQIAGRLRLVKRLCLAFAGGALLWGALSWLLVDRLGARPFAVPEPLPLALIGTALVLVLLSSKVRSGILRRALPRSAALAINREAVIAAYQRATLASFALLEIAAVLGLLVALLTAMPSYGVIVCGAVLFAMLTRWPRAGEVDRLIRGRAGL